MASDASISSSATDDRVLVAQCKGGNRKQFEQLVSPHLQAIKFISYSILKDAADTEDVVQETILKAYIHLDQLRNDESIRGWLLRIAANEAKMHIRKNRKGLHDSIDSEIADRACKPRQFASWRAIPSQELERQETKKVLAAALACLGDGYREVFVLRDVQHLSAAETAKILSISEGAVNTRLHRARLQMREYLTPFFKAPRRFSMAMPLRMMLLMGKTWLRKTISCSRVTKEISNYIDDSLAPDLRHQIDEHLKLCDRCSVVVDTTRKLLFVAGDESVFPIPFDCKIRWGQVIAAAEIPEKN